MPPVQISRDPFARMSLMRECIRTETTCKWCGQNNHRHLFRYFWQDDSGRVSPFRTYRLADLFCSKDCFEACNS